MKKETLEEAAERFYPINSTGGEMEMLNKHQLNNSYKQEGFIAGAKWQSERMYSEEEVLELLPKFAAYTLLNADEESRLSLKEWFEQFKK